MLLAHSRAAALGLEPSAEIQRWYAAISCCLQRSNAKISRGGPVPGEKRMNSSQDRMARRTVTGLLAQWLRRLT